MDVEIKTIPVSKIETNNGQLAGLPKNPRFIRDDKYEKLKRSIDEFPEMLSLRELVVYQLESGNYIIVGGNMRFRACKELKYRDMRCKVFPKDTPIEQLKEFAIKDNISYGSYDWDALANEWNQDVLEDWGMDVDLAIGDGDLDNNEIDGGKYTAKIDTPIYEPSETPPKINELIDTAKFKELIKEINDSQLGNEEKEFLILSAHRHLVFDYSKVADYYASSSEDMQRLMENSALVIIDFEKAIEDGFVKLSESIINQYTEEHGT